MKSIHEDFEPKVVQVGLILGLVRRLCKVVSDRLITTDGHVVAKEI